MTTTLHSLGNGAKSPSTNKVRVKQSGGLMNLPDDRDTRDRIVLNESIGHLLRKAYQNHSAIFQNLCIDPQLTSVQLATLFAVSASGLSSLRDVGRAAALDPATTRGVVDRLKLRGLVVLSPDVNDKRKVLVDLSLAGHRLVKEMIPCSRKIGEKTLEALNPAEQIALTYLLKKITES
jgi:MarR family transcriptional regulator, lower aerobic nicotinate degradation pathway regulator